MNWQDFPSLTSALNLLSPGDILESKRSSGSGGCINSTYLLTMKSGVIYFIKENESSPKDMFLKEAKGLEILAKSYPITTPKPMALGHEGQRDFLIMEFIQSAKPKVSFWLDFGRSLAILHQCKKSSSYGLEHNNYIGRTVQDNGYRTSWTDFFSEKRLLFQLELAASQNLVDQKIRKGIESICKRINRLLPEPDGPSLLHGDLWSGNFMVDCKGDAALIDPAVYYGHREADLAMTQLFGGFEKQFYHSYDEYFPIDKGYEERKDLYNLYHMLNHLNLFGSSYQNSVRSIISNYL